MLTTARIKKRLIIVHTDISQYLGRTECIKASSAKSFARKIAQYIDSENQHSGVGTTKKRGKGGRRSKVGKGSDPGGESRWPGESSRTWVYRRHHALQRVNPFKWR